ncbi:restriction endonuclease subunit S [Microbacterium sp.]|uniref:restriction endonuclease subunit S n=1 Tax=Microbacterium sp. TaxID=51671 RepID=UPI0037CAD782
MTKHAGFVPSEDYFKKRVYSKDLTTYKVVDVGQFAYATIHLDEGSIGVAPVRCVISPMYTVFSIDHSRVDEQYLIRFLKSPQAMATYPVLGRGTAERRRSISLDALSRLRVPLPPLPEQRRIAAILDEADALVATVRRQVLRIDEAEDRLFDATLGISQAKRTLTLADIATDFRYGTSARAGGTGFPVLRIPNVTGRAIDINDLKTVDLADSERNRLELTDRDVLFVRSNGNPKLVGRAAAFESLPAALRGEAPWVFASYLIRARLAPHISSRAVVAAARSRVGRQHLVGAAATSAGQYNISIPVLKNLPMFDPYGGAQSKFDEASQSLTTQRALLDRRLESLVALAASLRHRAFRGELD